MLNFKDKLAVVTGGASGIGEATVRSFHTFGARVVILDINQQAGLRMRDALGDRVHYFYVDVANSEDVARVAAHILKELGPVNFLVSNAGVEYNHLGNLLTMPEDKLHEVLQVNLRGAINCARSFIPSMQRGDSVVFVSSIQGFGAHLPGTTYQVSKSGLSGVVHALAVECGKQGIRVNAVAPGGVVTEGMGAARSGDENIIHTFRKRIPLGRRARTEEIAEPILFLCSDWASYITGTTLVVDGGYLCNLTTDLGFPTEPVPGDPDPW